MGEGLSREGAERRALGDGSAGAMIVFPYNCPTMTVPALWLRGTYHGVPWLPLVERSRRKPENNAGFVEVSGA